MKIKSLKTTTKILKFEKTKMEKTVKIKTLF